MTAARLPCRLLTVLLVLAFTASAPGCPRGSEPGEAANAGHAMPGVAEDRLQDVFPGFEQVHELAEPFPSLAVYAAGDSLLGYVADSDHAGTTAPGYAGPVPVLAFFGPDGSILDFDVLDNRETPGYLAIALGPDFRQRMASYRPGKDEPVDAVSLATITSVGIIKSLTGLADRIARELGNLPAEP